MAKAVLMKAGESIMDVREEGTLYRNVLKTDILEANLTHILPGTETSPFMHRGQEFKVMIRGTVEYGVGDEVYTLGEGDMLFHDSSEKHWARNIGNCEAVFMTISTPPTFSLFER